MNRVLRAISIIICKYQGMELGCSQINIEGKNIFRFSFKEVLIFLYSYCGLIRSRNIVAGLIHCLHLY